MSERTFWPTSLLGQELTEALDRLSDESRSFELVRRIIFGRDRRLSTSSYGIFNGSLGSVPIGSPRSSNPFMSGAAQESLARILVWRMQGAQAVFSAFCRRKALLTGIGKSGVVCVMRDEEKLVAVDVCCGNLKWFGVLLNGHSFWIKRNTDVI